MEGEEAIIAQGQLEFLNLMLAYIEPMAVKCALELHIPNIIHSHGSPMSLSEIATKIGSTSLSVPYLSRLMRFLVHKNIFSVIPPDDQSGETLYDLTHCSRLLLQDSEKTETKLTPAVLLLTHPWSMDPWHQLSATIKDGEIAFNKVFGSSVWEFASKNPEFNNIMNNGIESLSNFDIKTVLSVYKDGFQNINTLVDVGGGKGTFVSEIVKDNWPRIKGINFDLQHVVDSAPEYLGVTHVGGDMFDSIPEADAITIRSVLSNWSDGDCKKILTNCKKALMKTKGKLILVDAVVQPNGKGLVNDLTLKYDLMMMVNCTGGMERTQVEWINLFKDVGFPQYKFITTPAQYSIIEVHAS